MSRTTERRPTGGGAASDNTASAAVTKVASGGATGTTIGYERRELPHGLVAALVIDPAARASRLAGTTKPARGGRR